MHNAEQTDDHYEALQVSSAADTEVIHRAFRTMAARLHPDNPVTGDSEKFLALQSAYQVLADPAQRARYNAGRRPQRPAPLPAPQQSSLGIGAEVSRRLDLLSLLYHQRCTNEGNPSLPARDLETRLGVPRGGLNFTLWYLRAKGYITREDSSDCAITAQGVDYIEEQASAEGSIAGLLTGKSDAELPSMGDAPIDRRPDILTGPHSAASNSWESIPRRRSVGQSAASISVVRPRG